MLIVNQRTNRVAKGLSNGDVILAEVQSDRNGRVTLLDLLTGKVRNKAKTDLLRRNHAVTKKAAGQIVATFHKKGRWAAREMAVEFGE